MEICDWNLYSPLYLPKSSSTGLLLTLALASLFLISLVTAHDAFADAVTSIPLSTLTMQNGVPTAGLVGEWRFENNASDTSGTGNNGVASGISYVSGKIGQAISFVSAGMDRIPYSPSLDFPTSSFSTSLWIKTTSSNLGWIVEHRRNNDACYAGYSIEDGGSGHLIGRLRICAPATDTAANFDVRTNIVNDGTWHHIVFVVDRAAQVSKIYQDGVLVSSLDISSLGNIGQTSIGVDIGNTASPNTPSTSFAGLLDQVRIYNRTLTDSDVAALYNEPGSPSPITPPSQPHLFAYSGNAQVGLSWSAPSSDGNAQITNYDIYRGSSPNSEILLKQVGNVLSYIDTTVANGQTYYYHVTAVNSAGQSPASNEVSAIPAAANGTGASIPRNGLAAEWRFENNTFDTSGNRNDGTAGVVYYVYGGCCPKVRSAVASGPGTYYPGKLGLALGFNGTDIDRVANSASLNFGNGSLSISGWIKTNQTSFLFVDHRRNNDGTYAGYSLEGINGTILGRIRDSSAHDVYAQTGQINDNQFHHVVLVVDRSTQTLRIYLDNNLQALANISQVGSIDQSSIGVDMGYTASPNTPNSPFVGVMDQVRIYNRAITDNEIQSLFLEQPSSGQPTPPQNLAASSNSNPVSLSWSAPSGSGNSAITNYNIYRGTISGRETFLVQTGNTLNYVDNAVTNGQRYFYEVTAVNSDGESSASKEVSVIPASVPSAPHLVLSSECSTEVDLNWSATNNGGSAITNYTIYRGATAGSEALLAETGSAANYADTSVTNGQTYYYYIKAVNSVGQSPASNEINATPSNSTSCIPTAGLVGEWRFENNASDTSGTGNNGVASGVTYVSGKIGQAISFGSSGIDQIPYSPSLDFPTTSFSTSLWIKTTSSNLGLIVDHRRNNDACYAGYSIEDGGSGHLIGRLRICAPATDTAANFDVHTNIVNDGAWHHIVFVVDRSSNISKIYQDGVLVSSLDISSLGNIGQTSIGVDIGNTASPNTPSTSFPGLLDQIRIYNLVLSDSEIKSLYTESSVMPTSGIVLNDVKSTSGTASNQMTIPNFNAGTGNNRLLVVGVSANNNDVTSVTFGGVQLTQAASSFYNNDAEFWYLANPSGTGDVVVTMSGSTQAVVGAYSFSGVNQTMPVPTNSVTHNTSAGSPSISISAQRQNDWVLDLPSIYGGSTLAGSTCTQQWDANVPNQITGASSSAVVQSPGIVTCSWTASAGDLWDDVAIEINAAR